MIVGHAVGYSSQGEGKSSLLDSDHLGASQEELSQDFLNITTTVSLFLFPFWHLQPSVGLFKKL